MVDSKHNFVVRVTNDEVTEMTLTQALFLRNQFRMMEHVYKALSMLAESPGKFVHAGNVETAKKHADEMRRLADAFGKTIDPMLEVGQEITIQVPESLGRLIEAKYEDFISGQSQEPDKGDA